MKVVSIFAYALKAYNDGRYETLETLSKAEHCFYLIELTRKSHKLNAKPVNFKTTELKAGK